MAQATNRTDDEIRALIDEWAAAELRGDAQALDRLLAADFVGIGPLGFMLTKEQWLARFASGDLRYEAFAVDEVRVRPYGDAAVVTARQSQTGTYRGQAIPVPGPFRATLIFVRSGGRWLLAGLHLSQIAQGR